MTDGIIVDYITWHARTMTIRGKHWLSPELATMTVAYAHVSSSQLWTENDWERKPQSALHFRSWRGGWRLANGRVDEV